MSLGRMPNVDWFGLERRWQVFLLLAELVNNLLTMQETLVRFLGREDPLEKE